MYLRLGCWLSRRISSNSSDLKSAKHNLTLVHYLHPQTCPVKNISPSRKYFVLTINNGLVKIKAIEVKSHRRNTKSSKPDSNYRPCGKEEMQTAWVVERSILENKSSKVTVSQLSKSFLKGWTISSPIKGAGRSCLLLRRLNFSGSLWTFLRCI